MFRLLFVLLGLSLFSFKIAATLGWALMSLTGLVWLGWIAHLVWAIATNAPATPAARR